MHRIDGDVTERQVLVEILIRADVAAAGFEAHFDVQLAALAHGGDVNVAIEHFHVGVGFDLAAAHGAWSFHVQAHGLDAIPAELEGNLFEVEDDVGGVFNDARYRAEFMLDAFDAHGGNGRAFNGAQQHAPQAVADGGAEAALERLGGEHAIPLGESIGIGDQTFRFLKALEHRISWKSEVRSQNRAPRPSSGS